MIKVMVVEDQVMLREALITLINDQWDMEAVAGIGSAGDALEVCETLRPDLVLMDVLTEPAILPGAEPLPTGITATTLIRKKFPKVKVVIITSLP
ncbi:MAG: response regulator transcription factor, partial [Treponema sp.]|nr:response regulator transcription factor [Treponema sp.]